jgi:putative transposase
VRPHSHNLGLTPNEKEEYYWKTSNGVAKKG